MTFPLKPGQARAVDWWPVHLLVSPVLETVECWPVVGTIPWHELDNRDPAKWAAVLDGGRKWAVMLDARQDAMNDASHAISKSADWSSVSRNMLRGNDVYIPRRIA